MSNDDKKFFGLCIVVEDKVEDKKAIPKKEVASNDDWESF